MLERTPRVRDDQRDIEEWVGQLVLQESRLRGGALDRGDVKLLVRSFLELQECLELLEPLRDRKKVVVFGSARTKPDEPAYQLAEAFGRRMAAEGWMVVTGAGPGIMEAAHKGAGLEHALGFNIKLPFEQGANPYVSDAYCRTLNYFFTRKLLFLKDTHAVVLFPGGYGTMDEGFETLTLVQTGRAGPLPIVLMDAPGQSYWKDWDIFVRRQLLDTKLISEEDLHLYLATQEVEPAAREIMGFYRNYHSQRYVRGDLTLRLQRPLPASLVVELRKDFADLLRPGGKIEMAEAHPHESNEPSLRDLPRLRVGFNRRAFGRLRQLIDRLNAAPLPD